MVERESERDAMVDTQLLPRGIEDRRVTDAMRVVPRHAFVLDRHIERAYEDRPLPLGHDATISQPYIVALMLELAEVRPGDRVLDIGTGSGYQAALLGEMGAEVVGIERVEALAEFARERLEATGHAFDVQVGDGHGGRPEHAPYDAIVCAAAASDVPSALLEQLAVGGRLVIPVGPPWEAAVLRVVRRTKDGHESRDSIGVRFVPLQTEGHSRSSK